MLSLLSAPVGSKMITQAFLVGYGIYTRCCQKGRQYLGMLWLYENL